ncbi:Zinc finger BED domain-containing protein 5 [Araneus ventricosus]|uniref:Zinc finger BED domain-containing protein 5 n=1 Tax=Araneus ventricosus TaxID=182803 RepID=A0A4Y2F2C2_ARAVE|nr:Zinc finger BED domain-containing protein 5 [Araneus ventricosus]
MNYVWLCKENKSTYCKQKINWLPFQGKYNIGFQLWSKITSECFQTLSDFLEESEVDLDMEIRDGIKTHLSSLQQSLSDYFPNLENQDHWVQNPFKIKEKPQGFHSMNYENLIELSSDTQLEAKFRTVSLTIFWSDVFIEYPNLAKQAIRILLPFATTYLCEAGFSKYVATKTKYRNKLDVHQICEFSYQT